jgi:hypothetical protein
MERAKDVQGISGFLDFIHRPVFEGTRWIKSRNPEIPCVIHHRHNPSETAKDVPLGETAVGLARQPGGGGRRFSKKVHNRQ